MYDLLINTSYPDIFTDLLGFAGLVSLLEGRGAGAVQVFHVR